MPFVVGLTGGIGSGKTTVADHFARLGIALVDTDLIARELVAPGERALAQIVAHFGETLQQADGTLDRAALRQRVFAQPEERRWLEALLHPLIRQRTRERLRAATSPYALLVSPLLLETDQHRLVDHILVIDLPVEQQLQRTMARDDNDKEQVAAIIASQIERQQRLARADSVLDNSRSLATLPQRVAALDAYFRQLAATTPATHH